MTVSIQLKSFAEAKTAIGKRSAALTLDFIGPDLGGWTAWHICRGGCVEPVGSVHEAPDGVVILQLDEAQE